MAEMAKSSPMSLRIVIALVCLNMGQVELKNTNHAWKTNGAPHHVISVDSCCTKDYMEIRIGFGSTPGAPPFRGAIHAKGFPLECHTSPTNVSSETSPLPLTFLTLKLPAESCGVRVVSTEDGRLAYQVEVDIQWDRNLQQSTDQSRLVTCFLSMESLHGTREPKPKQIAPQRRRYSSRSGRKEDFANEGPSQYIQAWMEVHGNKRSNVKLPHHRSHIVGEQLTMVVKSFLPSGIGARVVNCTAHDGRVNGPEQRLLDQSGCPLDVGIMPAPTSHRRKQNGTSSKQKSLPTYEAATSFLAFKFPDREFLHLRCWLQICKDSCKNVSCSLQNEYYEAMPDEHDDNEITRLEVFNSLTVIAPGIERDASEMGSLSQKEIVDFIDEKIGAERRLLCMSPSKLALAFAVLGLIFLLAIAISVYVCLRSRRRHEQKSMLGAFYWPSPPSLSRSSSNASFLPRSKASCPFFRTAR